MSNKHVRHLLSSTRMPTVMPPPIKAVETLEIDPNASMAQRITTLSKLILSKSLRTLTVTVTPDLAAYILTINYPHNRRKKPSAIKKYAKDMEDDKWELNGETIKFADDGFLHDGQNRMHACVRSQKPFTTLMVFGLPASSFNSIDNGKGRGGDDLLTINGYTNTAARAAALRWLIILESKTPGNRSMSFPPLQLLERQKKLDTDGDDRLFNDMLTRSDTIYRKAKIFTKSPMAALLFLYTKHNPNCVVAIVDDLDKDMRGMRSLRLVLDSLASSAARSVEDSVRNAYIIMAFNEYYKGYTRISKSFLNWTRAMPYPALPF